MKRLVCICMFLIGVSSAWAQTQIGGTESPIFYNNKSVGIGYNLPTAQLSLGIWAAGECGPQGGKQLSISGKHNAGANLGGIKLLIEGYDNDGTVTYPIFLKDENYNVDYWIKNRPAANGVPTMYFAGKIGIGTTVPWAKLSISSTSYPFQLIYTGSDAIANQNRYYIGMGNKGFSLSAQNDNNNWTKTIMHFEHNGNVGIGTTVPKSKLDVFGTITATEIKVQAQTADFVFEDNYQLKSLSEVEQFITTNKHLPDIPSARQMEEEGVGLAEMNKLLLQKIEELTLYLIEKDKKVNQLEKEIQEIKEKLK